MSEENRIIENSDIMDLASYESVRAERRKWMAEYKLRRRLNVGPYAVFMFEDYHTMLHQVHEMLAIERGGAEQLVDELEAYNPLIPGGRELVATIMFQIDDEILRKKILGGLGGIEEHVLLRFGGVEVRGRAEEDVDRTSADGKASSVQFVHFDFNDSLHGKFLESDEVMVGFDHVAYSHFGVMPKEVKESLMKDFL